MPWARPLVRLTERRNAGIHALEHQGPPEQGQGEQRRRGDAGEEQKRRVVQAEDASEQDVQEVDIAAAQGDDHDAEGERDQVEAGKRRVLAQDRGARDQPGQQRHRETGGEPAQGHRRQRQAGDEKADRRPRQDRVRHGIAGQAEPAQHQEHADRRRAQRQCRAADQCPAHEAELDERGDEKVVGRHAAERRQIAAS